MNNLQGLNLSFVTAANNAIHRKSYYTMLHAGNC